MAGVDGMGEMINEEKLREMFAEEPDNNSDKNIDFPTEATEVDEEALVAELKNRIAEIDELTGQATEQNDATEHSTISLERELTDEEREIEENEAARAAVEKAMDVDQIQLPPEQEMSEEELENKFGRDENLENEVAVDLPDVEQRNTFLGEI